MPKETHPRTETPVEFVPPDNMRPGEIGTLIDFTANPLDKNVLLYDGEELVGAKQNRVLERSILVGAASIVLVSTSINFWQTYRSQQAADRLRASVTPTASEELHRRCRAVRLLRR